MDKKIDDLAEIITTNNALLQQVIYLFMPHKDAYKLIKQTQQTVEKEFEKYRREKYDETI